MCVLKRAREQNMKYHAVASGAEQSIIAIAFPTATDLSPFFGLACFIHVSTNGEGGVNGIHLMSPSSVSKDRQLSTMAFCSSSSWARCGGLGNASRTSASTTLPFLCDLLRMSSTNESVLLMRKFIIHRGMIPPTSPCWTRVRVHTLGATGASRQSPPDRFGRAWVGLDDAVGGGDVGGVGDVAKCHHDIPVVLLAPNIPNRKHPVVEISGELFRDHSNR